MKPRFERFLSTDNPKAIKAEGFGYLNAINYMAPHTSGGVGNLCSHASAGCIAICLAEHSGQAAMSQTVRDSRKRKAQYFMRERKAFMAEFTFHIAKAYRAATKAGLKLCVRPNGATDIAFEGVAFEIDPILAGKVSKLIGREFPAGKFKNIFEAFPEVQFVDYTKNPRRFDRSLPSNYHLTFSRSETNESEAKAILKRGYNVAVVFAHRGDSTFIGGKVVDGDKHDLRHLDPQGGFIIGLTPKGHRAKADRSGFVVRT
jgi:hypothetical protein